MNLDIENKIEKNMIEIGNDIGIKQNEFLQSDIGKTVNAALDIGIKAVLPDLIENQVINIKDAILESGFKEGLNEVINSGIELGKSVTGIFTGNFENMNQVENVVKNGGILDGVSKLLDFSINLAQKNKLINSTVGKMIKQGKNTIISSISNKLEETLKNQVKAVEKLENYCGKWNECYGNKDFDGMEHTYKYIEKYLSSVVPFENIINNARKIENMHNLIKNNGQNFNISENEIKLAEKLVLQ